MAKRGGRRRKPLEQGQTRLCGPFAVVNSIAVTTGTVLNEWALVFLLDGCFRHLSRRRLLDRVMQRGMHDEELWGLIGYAVRHMWRTHVIRVTAHRPFQKDHHGVGLRKYARSMKEFLSQDGRAALICFGIYQDEGHYSVVVRATGSSLILYDGRMRRLSLKACAVGEAMPSRLRRYVIAIESTVFFETET